MNKKAANAVYERSDLMKQAKKDIRYGVAFCGLTYIAFMIFALYVDYYSIIPMFDQVLRTNQEIGEILTLSVVFCFDILIPITMTKLLKAHFNQRKLSLALIVSVFLSLGIPLVIMIVQKMLGTELTMPDRDTTVINTPMSVKVATQLLFALVPLATTVGLTVLGLIRENIKVFRKYRYLQLAIAQITAEKDHITEALESDLETLAKRDDMKFISGVTEVLAMQETMFVHARELLAARINSPGATETILNATPVYRTTPQYDHIHKCLMLNPAVHVVFEEEESKEDNHNVSIQKKEEFTHEKKAV